MDPRTLNVRQFCSQQQHLEGDWPMTTLNRLKAGLFAEPEASQQVQWSLQGNQVPGPAGAPELWLHLLARASVTLQCQRCLQAMDQPLLVDRKFRFVHSEEEAERLDELSEEDVLVLSPKLDAVELLEDELILALPLVPRHEPVCPNPLPLSVDELDLEEPAPNPFAALAALRGGRGPVN
jgi:uncharacterized protein